MNWVESIGKTPGLALASVTQVAGWAIEAGAVAHDQVGAIGRSLFHHLQSIPGVSIDVAAGMQKAVEEAMKECLARAADGMPKQCDLQHNAEKMVEAAGKLQALAEHLKNASAYLSGEKLLEKGMLVSKGFEGLALLAGGLLQVTSKLSKAWYLTRNAKAGLGKLSGHLEAVNLACLCLKDGLGVLFKHRPDYGDAFHTAAVEFQRAAEELTKLATSVQRFAASFPAL